MRKIQFIVVILFHKNIKIYRISFFSVNSENVHFILFFIFFFFFNKDVWESFLRNLLLRIVEC